MILTLDGRDLYNTFFETDRETGTHTPIISPKARIIDIGFGDLGISKWSHDYERLQEVDLQILGDTRAVLPLLIDELQEFSKGRESLIRKRAERHRMAHNELRARFENIARYCQGGKPFWIVNPGMHERRK